MIELTIAVLSVPARASRYLTKIFKQLREQTEGKPVELLCFLDNCQRTVGEKRQACLNMAKGQYIAFVDDDDEVRGDYIDSLLAAIRENSGVDVIVFDQEMITNGANSKIVKYGMEFKDLDDNMTRKIPNHFMCHRTENARRASYKAVNAGEDKDWASHLYPYIKSQHRIDKVLYIYNFNSVTTVAQDRVKLKSLRKSGVPVVDVIILANTLNHELRDLTQNYAINSCVTSEPKGEVRFNIVLLEGNPDSPPYDNCETVYPPLDWYSYSRYANYGLNITHNDLVCIAHNDCHFHPFWASRQLQYMFDYPDIMSTSAFCMYSHPPRGVRQDSGNYFGLNYQFTPWCFLHRRELYRALGGMWDEHFTRWQCAEDLRLRMQACQIKHALVTSAVVNHIDRGAKTHNFMNLDVKLIRDQEERLRKKWNLQSQY